MNGSDLATAFIHMRLSKKQGRFVYGLSYHLGNVL